MSPRTPKLLFPAYRKFDQARIEANNAMVAMLVGVRFSDRQLQLHAGSKVMLPDIYPAIRGVDMLNRTVDDTREILAGVEQHLAYMALPYVQSHYEDLVVESVSILKRDGKPTLTSAESKAGLKGKHDYVQRVTNAPLPADLLALSDFIRAARNCVAHNGGIVDAKVVSAWSAMTQPARLEWETLAGRTFDPANLGQRFVAGAGELVAALALWHRLARELGSMMATFVTRGTWLAVALDDFAIHHPAGLRRRSDLLRKVKGYVRVHYLSIGISEQEIHTELSSRGLV